jgi:hypothetical protein
MKLSASKLVLFLVLLVVIWGSMSCSCSNVYEAFSNATSWKMNGQYTIVSPYKTNDTTPDPSMFIFSNNKITPECCKSADYSSSTGCVCTTPEQRNFINQRGGNRTIEDGF